MIRWLAAATMTLLLAARSGLAWADDGMRWPPGSRVIDGVRVSGRGFRETVDWVARQLTHAGVTVTRIGPYRLRGVDVVRFLGGADAPFTAVHVYRKDGRVFLFLVPADPPVHQSVVPP